MRRNPLDPDLWKIIYAILIFIGSIYLVAQYKQRKDFSDISLTPKHILYVWFGVFTVTQYHVFVSFGGLTRPLLLATIAFFTGAGMLSAFLIGRNE